MTIAEPPSPRLEGDDQFLTALAQGDHQRVGLVVKAKKEGLAGATVFRGLMGFGANSRIHTSKILRLSLDLPVVVEIVDTPEKIAQFLAVIESVVTEGLVTLEKTEVRVYRGKDQDN